MMRRGLAAGLVLLIVLVAVLWFWMNGPVDRCLDAGGAWDYSKGVCRP